MHPFIALTDQAWFDHLASCAENGVVDEVNFWSPRSLRPMKILSPGEPVFLRLKSPYSAIAGYGFFAHHCVLDLREAWDFFGWKNGDPDEANFLRRIGGYRSKDLLALHAAREKLGCTILRNTRFWPRERWLAWGEAQGFSRHNQRGASCTEAIHADRLLVEVAADRQSAPEDLTGMFLPMDSDERSIVTSRQVQRQGQGTFRARLMDAYGRRCAITGERTELVLDAAHIQPYLGPRSNHLQNGLLLTKEFHTLFDHGYVTVSSEQKVIVSPRLRREWHNGKRYYDFDDQPLRAPEVRSALPSPAALAWHRERMFRN